MTKAVNPNTSTTPATTAGERSAAPDTAAAQPLAARTSLDGDTVATREAEAVAAPKGTYTVAPGRTVDGKKPGETVELDKGDAERMTKLGFVLDRDGSVVIQTDGPRVVQGQEIVER